MLIASFSISIESERAKGEGKLEIVYKGDKGKVIRNVLSVVLSLVVVIIVGILVYKNPYEVFYWYCIFILVIGIVLELISKIRGEVAKRSLGLKELSMLLIGWCICLLVFLYFISPTTKKQAEQIVQEAGYSEIQCDYVAKEFSGGFVIPELSWFNLKEGEGELGVYWLVANKDGKQHSIYISVLTGRIVGYGK